MKTKLILASFAMVVLMVAAVGTGTLAYFSDVETSADNTFTAGTIDISVDGDNPWDTTYEVTVGGPEGDAELKPCQVGYINYTIKNEGTNPLVIYKMIDDVRFNTGYDSYACCCLGGESFYVSSEPECEAACNSKCACDENDMRWMIGFDLSLDDVVEIEFGDAITIGLIEGCYMSLGELGAGETMKVSESFHLDADAGNIYQGDVMIFDETLIAYQCEGYIPDPPGQLCIY